LAVLRAGAGSHVDVQVLAVTLAFAGLTLLILGAGTRERILGLASAGCFAAAYMCELLYYDVTQVQVYVLPAGIALLIGAWLQRRARGNTEGAIALELIGVILVLATSLLQALGQLGAGDQRLAYDTLLLTEGAVAWIASALLHWKRTFFAANAAIIAAVCIWLSRGAGSLRHANIGAIWVVFIIGCILIGLAIAMERARERIPLWIDAVRLRLETWL
jgi:hypothetical protein